MKRRNIGKYSPNTVHLNVVRGFSLANISDPERVALHKPTSEPKGYDYLLTRCSLRIYQETAKQKDVIRTSALLPLGIKIKTPLTSFLSPLGRGRKKKKMPSSPLKTGVKRRKIRDEHSET